MQPLKSSQIWISEAENALKYIEPQMNLPPESRVLEVGSGACILLGHLANSHKSIKFTGIEPIGPGFESIRKFVMAIQNQSKIELFNGGYEEFDSTELFDLIYLVNVFEHLSNWQDFLKFAKKNLKPNGKCVILCPNYGLPYESHYGIPIIFNKNITFKIFKGFIRKFDKQYDCEGLWNSLNFVKYRDVKYASRDLGLNITFDPEVSFDFITRLDEDKEFQQRQGYIGKLARVFKQIGILKLLKHRVFWNIHPYMHLIVSKN